MANEHIGRLQSIGIGKETTSGTAVSASVWIPKLAAQFSPKFEKAVDNAAYGVIDEVYDSQTVKNTTEITLSGVARDVFLGNFLLGALGTEALVFCGTITGTSGGTPARGDAVSSATGAYTGVIRKILTIGATTYYFISKTTGASLTNQTDLTNGTWTGGTVDFSTFAAVKGHFFSRLNTNAHPSFTVIGSDPVASEQSAYCMIDTLELEASIGDFAKFTAKLLGKKLASAGAVTPSYTAENPFMAKYAAVKFAANEAALNAATASSLQRFKITINKNLTDVQAFGDTDIASIHNQQFGIKGDFDAIYNAVTFRDYVANSTKKAARFSFVNTEATVLYSATPAADSVYPALYIDMAQLSFEEWSRTQENNGLVSQTSGFSGEFKVADGMTIEMLLLNTRATAY